MAEPTLLHLQNRLFLKNIPTFQEYVVEIREDALPLTRLLSVSASDLDSGVLGDLAYSLDPASAAVASAADGGRPHPAFIIDPVEGYLVRTSVNASQIASLDVFILQSFPQVLHFFF